MLLTRVGQEVNVYGLIRRLCNHSNQSSFIKVNIVDFLKLRTRFQTLYVSFVLIFPSLKHIVISVQPQSQTKTVEPSQPTVIVRVLNNHLIGKYFEPLNVCSCCLSVLLKTKRCHGTYLRFSLSWLCTLWLCRYNFLFIRLILVQHQNPRAIVVLFLNVLSLKLL